MSTMNLTVTLLIAKGAAALSRLLGRGGGQALPGLLADYLDPHLARKLAVALPHGVIIVTGTNGKTTTTKLIASVLEANGEHVLTNRTGSNLKRGVTSALIAASNLHGGLNYSIGLFEVDEASLRLVAPELLPKHIIVLNLFRDQLDRYGELDTTASLIGQGIAATSAKVYLNADDPLVASLAKYVADPDLVSYFGIENLSSSRATALETASDSDRCPLCNRRLEFEKVFFGHIGHYRCPAGDFVRPKPSVAITSIIQSSLTGTDFTVSLDGRQTKMSFPLPGTYNLYNALAAISLAKGIGVDQAKISSVLAVSEAAFGRVEKVELNGRILYLLLIKNPAGFAQVLETFLVGRDALNVMMVVNDLAADGRDVSWLWDVPLEALATTRPSVLTAGTRGSDMSLRLYYAGVESRDMPSVEAAVDRFLEMLPDGGTGYVLPTYTAMIEVRKVLSNLTHMAKI